MFCSSATPLAPWRPSWKCLCATKNSDWGERRAHPTKSNRTLKRFLCRFKSLPAQCSPDSFVSLRSQTRSSAGTTFKQCWVLAIEEESTYLLINFHFIKALLPLNLHCNNFRPRLWFVPFLAVFNLLWTMPQPWCSTQAATAMGCSQRKKKNQIIPCVTTPKSLGFKSWDLFSSGLNTRC